MLLRNTFNFSFFLLMFLFVKFNIILLNEETLILIIFSIFCILSVIRLRGLTTHYFESQFNAIKISLVLSNSKLKNSFQEKQQNIDISTNWVTEFLKLKSHLIVFNSFVLAKLIQFHQLKLIQQLEKKFLFSKNLEQQFSKLVSLILLDKVTKVTKVKIFCKKTLLLKKFGAIEKLYFREYLTKI